MLRDAPACSGMDHPAWQILVQHRSISSNQQVLLLLLSTSQAARTTILTHCAGMLPVRCAVGHLQAAEQFSSWIRRNCSLVKSMYLHIERFARIDDRDKAARMLATALQQSLADAANRTQQQQANAAAAALRSTQPYTQAAAAVAGPLQAKQLYASAAAAVAASTAKQLQAATTAMMKAGKLQLLEFRISAEVMSTQVPLATAATFLQQLPASCLTCLYLQSAARGPALNANNNPDAKAARDFQQALARLTSLRSLSLLHSHAASSIPALVQLGQLTELQLGFSIGAADAQLLPASLVTLQLKSVNGRWRYILPGREQHAVDPLNLKHCTSLTYLNIGDTIQPRDQLPPDIKVLSIHDCPAVQPILQLGNLVELHVLLLSEEGSQLLPELNSMTQLSRIRVAYVPRAPDEAPAAVAAWGRVLRMRELALRDGYVREEAVVQQFSALGRLTKLELIGGDWAGDTAEERMELCGKAIKQCTGLQELIVNNQVFNCGIYHHAIGHPFAEVLSGLPSLKALRVIDTLDMAGCFSEFKSTQLTGLTVTRSLLNVHEVMHIATNLKSLLSLDLSNSVNLKDYEDDYDCDCDLLDVVGCMASTMTQLTHLDVSNTNAYESECLSAETWLAAMPWLQQLCV